MWTTLAAYLGLDYHIASFDSVQIEEALLAIEPRSVSFV